jgi:hypothetical protein
MNQFASRKRSFLALLVLTFFAIGLFAQDPLTNSAIIRMVKSGLSETVILSVVNQQPGSYSTKVDDLIILKEAGVPDKVVAAMLAKASGGTAPAASTAASASTSTTPAAGAMEIGVYFKKGESWEEVLPEVVNWKTGGTIKNLASVGVVKKDLNGNIAGPSSRNSVKSPMEFLIVASEGVAITEYQLIRLRINKDYREFRTVTGGVFNQQSGAMRDLVPFEGKKVGPRTFSVVLPSNLGSGQYGFLSPGAMGSSGNSQAQIGKMYTFHLVE